MRAGTFSQSRSTVQLIKAREYVKSGGNLSAIKAKYNLTKEQEQELSTL